MIQNKIKLILILIIGIFSNSCLDLDPKDQMADSNLWNQANDFKLFANNFYGWTRNFKTSVYDGPHTDSRSDLMTGQKFDQFSNGTNTIPVSDVNYKDAYDRIRRTNLLLENAETFDKPTEIKTYIGEAQFFRAYLYFELLQLYGDVTISKTPLEKDSPELYAKRNPRTEVVDFIIADLKDAIGNLSLTTPEDGRLTIGAAQAFLSRVALFEGTWQKSRNNETRANELLGIAVNAANEVMKSGEYSLFKPEALGITAQKYMFILENEKSNPADIKKSANKEYIFYKRHDQVLKPIGENITHHCFGNAQYLTRKLANMYLASDGLPIDKSATFLGYNNMNTEFQNRDNRMDQSFLVAGRAYWRDDNPRVTWLGDAEDLANTKYKSYSTTSNSGYHSQKWATERKVTSRQEGYDYPVIRYAEVLLNYAEAIFERDGSISDVDLNKSLNLVRLRINPDMPRLSNNLVSANGLDMKTEIRRERTIELFNEGFRIDDLKRWKTAETEMPMDLLGIKWEGTEFESKWAKPGYGLNAEGCFILETGRQWSEQHYLYPIPADQLQLNPNLGQNPHWGKK